MARIRTIKPEFWTSEQIMECSPNARLLFIGLWNFCDDAGIHPASPKTLKAEIFPSDDISASEVEGLVGELIAQGLLEKYEVAGHHYWAVTGWHHQRIDQPTFKHPRPDGTVPAGAARRRAERRQANQPESARQSFGEQHANSRRTLDECSPPEGNGREGSGHGDDNPPLVPPEGGSPACSAKKRAARQQLTFADWCEDAKAKGERFISDYAPVWEYAKKVSLPDEFVMLAFQVFKDRYTNGEKGKRKTYADWRLAFLNAIKSDWFRLWRVDADGRYCLTSAGLQADLEHRKAA